MKLSEKIMKLRKEKGLSQEEFGNEINVSRQAVSKWETEEAKPDMNKIKEIVRKFDVSYDYLLNDEIEEENQVSNYKKKSGGKIALKIILGVVLFYLLICIYKMIAFYRFYMIANSFSEEKYSMTQNLSISNQFEHKTTTSDITKVGSRTIKKFYDFDGEHAIKDENGETLPYEIHFTDTEKKICYELFYDVDRREYRYHNRKEDMISEEEIEGLFQEENLIKSNTFGIIPAGLKEIFLASVDPRCYFVSIRNRQYQAISFLDGSKIKVELNEDYLVERVSQQFEYGSTIVRTFNYDYVPEHFEKIENPYEEMN